MNLVDPLVNILEAACATLITDNNESLSTSPSQARLAPYILRALTWNSCWPRSYICLSPLCRTIHNHNNSITTCIETCRYPSITICLKLYKNENPYPYKVETQCWLMLKAELLILQKIWSRACLPQVSWRLRFCPLCCRPTELLWTDYPCS
jgi:hypothetical protein